MATISFIGNLTKDAERKTTDDGRKYLLLQVAENIRKKDDNGNYVKDDNGHYVSSQTHFYSVFVNDGQAVMQAIDLKKGDPVKVFGIAKFAVEKDSENYDKYVLNSVSALNIDSNPFGQNEEELASDAELENIPFEPSAA